MCEGPYITQASTVEIAGMGVYGVLPLPMVVGCEAEHSGDESPNFIGSPRAEKRIVSAVVKNNKNANQQAARQDGQRNRQPIGNAGSQIHYSQQKEITAY